MQATETPQRTVIPTFQWRNFKFPGGLVSTQIEYLGREIPAHISRKDSLTLAEERAIYELALAARHGELSKNLSSFLSQHVEPNIRIYNNIHETETAGNWTDDAVNYDSPRRKPRGVILPKGYTWVQWLKRPSLVRHAEDSKTWLTSVEVGDTEILEIPLPPTGYPIPTMDGIYRPDTGTPFATVTIHDRKEAIKKWSEAGYDRDTTERELSRFTRREGDWKGLAAVHRYNGKGLGPFAVYLDDDFDTVHKDVGSRFIARRTDLE